jgi:hypothetical protein
MPDRRIGVPRQRSLACRGLAWTVLGLAAAAWLAGAGEATAALSLNEANAFWRGAACALRIPIEIKSGRDGAGWSRSPHFGLYDPLERVLFWTFWVSDRAALAPVLRGAVLAPGTMFEARGWRLLKPRAEEGVTLELRLRDAPVDARFEFQRRGSVAHDSLPLSRLDQVERYLRLEVFQCERAPAPPSAPAAVPAPAPALAAAPPSAAATSFKPELEVLAVSVRPPRAAPGDTVDLVAVYRVRGVPPGTFFEVAERRDILRGEQRLQRLEHSVARSADEYTSSWPVRLPEGLAPGVYRLAFEALLAGLSARGEALFEVTP